MKRRHENGTIAPLQYKRSANGYKRDEEFKKKVNNRTIQMLYDGAEKLSLMKPVATACRMCLDKPADGVCSKCDRHLCQSCTQLCEKCDGSVCHFCCFIDYTKRWEQRKCVDCNNPNASSRQ